MKIKKILAFAAAGVFVLGLLAVIILALCLDGIVKKAVETVGPRLTQVSVTLDSIHIGVLSGSARVKGLIVGNPDGFKTTNAVSVGLAEVSVDVGSALSDKIVVHSIHLESPQITFEGGLGGNNLGKIMSNLNSITASTGPAGTNIQTTASGKPAKKIEVDDFLMTGAQVHVTLTDFGGRELTLPLPDIHLRDLGKGDAGLTPADLTRQIFSAISTTALTTVATSATGLGKDLGKDLGKGATDSINKITSGLGGLFKK